jgi:DNA replication and repair protein RecF
VASKARLARLEVRDFRNLAHVELSPPADGIVVVGENGQGKTNLLEAIYYLQILRSARGARDQDLIRFGADAFHIGASVDTDRCHEVGVGFERAGKRKRVRLDGDIPERLSDALGALPSVLFSPADVELIAGAPAARRRFLDIMLALTARGYLAALQRYRGALARRNAALREQARSGRSSAASVAVWEPTLAEAGAVLIRERQTWVDATQGRFEQLCHDIGETAHVRLRYAGTIDAGSDLAPALAAALEEKRPLDLRRGLTHAGPHRDDLAITMAGPDAVPRELRSFGSAGQQRSAAIALRMLEASTFTERTGRSPLFLLDDPFAELDVRRSARVLDLLSGSELGQTVLVVPRESDIPSEFTGLERVRVAAGQISPYEK